MASEIEYTYFDEIYSKFLSKVSDYELAGTNADDFEFALEQFLSGALGLHMTRQMQSLLDDINKDEARFGAKLTNTEQWMIATAMVYLWLDTKIYKEDLMRTSVTDRDYTETSPANQLRALKVVKEDLELELHKYDVLYSYIGFNGLD